MPDALDNAAPLLLFLGWAIGSFVVVRWLNRVDKARRWAESQMAEDDVNDRDR